MRWNPIKAMIYGSSTISSPPDRARRLGGGVLASGAEEIGANKGDSALMATQDYRAYVAEQSARRPSQIFENRNTSHAAVVIQHLLDGASAWAHFVTNGVNPVIYGSDQIIASVRDMLVRNPVAKVIFLAETPVDRKAHPLFAALDKEPGLGERIELRVVPGEVQENYAYNFGVNDRGDYRFERSRDRHEAIVQFGGTEFAQSLESTFQIILASAQSSTAC